MSNFRIGYDQYGLVVIEFDGETGESTPVVLTPEAAEAAAMGLLRVCMYMNGESVQ